MLKKQLFALLMVGALLPSFASAMENGGAAVDQQNQGQQVVDQPEADFQDPAENTGWLQTINKKADWACGYVNSPLNYVLRKITAANHKLQVLATLITGWAVFRAAPAVAEDAVAVASATTDTVKSLAGFSSEEA